MALRLSSKYNSNIVIDGEVIPIRIKRMGPDEALDFNRHFGRLGRRTQVQAPAATATEEEKRRYEQEDELAEREAGQFIVGSISKFVEVLPDHIFDDAQTVTEGSDVCRLFGARQDVLSELLLLIFMENRLDAEQKMNWRIRLAPFVQTPVDVAERMMEIGRVAQTDLVYDLGCGDGRLCIAAAKRGARAFGWDIDADRVAEAGVAAVAAGVADLCTFTHGDAMLVDVSKATVVVLYLLAGTTVKLRPVLLASLSDGARVVSHAFTLGGEWTPDVVEDVPLNGVASRLHQGQYQIYAYSVDRWRKTNRT